MSETMPKSKTYPFIIDEAKYIYISKFKEWKCLTPSSRKQGTITWSSNGVVTSSVHINVIFEEETKELHLLYSIQEKEYDYKISLVSLPSNLGEGRIWYFQCPFTGKRCRKLHLINGWFIHRSVLCHGMYSKQILSKKWRYIEKIYGNYFDLEKYYEELYSKHFTKFYNGIPSKRYQKLRAKIKDAKRFSAAEIESLFLL